MLWLVTRPVRAGALLLGLLLLAGGGYALYAGWRAPAADSVSEPWSQALEEDHYPRAREHLRRTLETRPFYAKAHFLMAQVCRRSDDLVGWRDHLARAEALQWPREEIEFERRLLRVQLGGPPDPVLLAHLESFQPATGLIFEVIVKSLLERYRLHDAVGWINRWLDHNPDDYRGWLYSGRAHYLNGARDRAITGYRRAWDLRPGQPTVRLWLAGALLATGQFAEALTCYTATLEEEPGHTGALLGAAYCLRHLNRGAEARPLLDELLAKQPANAGGLLVRARLDLDAELPAAALPWLQRAHEAAPGDPEILHALGQALRQSGRHDEAAKFQRREDELLELTRQLDEARKRALREPANVARWHETGVLCQRLRQDDDAFRWFEGALRIDAGHRPTHLALAEWYAKRGDTAQATEHRRRATSP